MEGRGQDHGLAVLRVVLAVYPGVVVPDNGGHGPRRRRRPGQHGRRHDVRRAAVHGGTVPGGGMTLTLVNYISFFYCQ